MIFARRNAIVLALAAQVAGCAAGSVRSHDASTRVSAGTVVTAQELARIVRQGSLLEALEGLRPGWLRSRGAAPGVSVDGGTPAELALLDMIPASTVSEVRFERASSGAGHVVVAPNGRVTVGDMILVTTRRGGGREP